MAKRKRTSRKRTLSDGGKGTTSVAAAYRYVKNGGTPRNGLEGDIKVSIANAKKEKKTKMVTWGHKLRGESNPTYDARNPHARPPGYRISKNGKLYYESRKNRAD